MMCMKIHLIYANLEVSNVGDLKYSFLEKFSSLPRNILYLELNLPKIYMDIRFHITFIASAA